MIVVNGPTFSFGQAPSTTKVLGSWFALLIAVHGFYLSWTPDDNCCHIVAVKAGRPFYASTGLISLASQASKNANYECQNIELDLYPGSLSSNETYQGSIWVVCRDPMGSLLNNIGRLIGFEVLKYCPAKKR